MLGPIPSRVLITCRQTDGGDEGRDFVMYNVSFNAQHEAQQEALA